MNYLIGETDAQVWARAWVRQMTGLSPAQRSAFCTDEGTMISWFANAIMAGYDDGAKHERQRDWMDKLREVIYQAAGAATLPFMQDHPEDVMPTERVIEGVEAV